MEKKVERAQVVNLEPHPVRCVPQVVNLEPHPFSCVPQVCTENDANAGLGKARLETEAKINELQQEIHQRYRTMQEELKKVLADESAGLIVVPKGTGSKKKSRRRKTSQGQKNHACERCRMAHISCSWKESTETCDNCIKKKKSDPTIQCIKKIDRRTRKDIKKGPNYRHNKKRGRDLVSESDIIPYGARISGPRLVTLEECIRSQNKYNALCEVMEKNKLDSTVPQPFDDKTNSLIFFSSDEETFLQQDADFFEGSTSLSFENDKSDFKKDVESFVDNTLFSMDGKTLDETLKFFDDIDMQHIMETDDEDSSLFPGKD